MKAGIRLSRGMELDSSGGDGHEDRFTQEKCDQCSKSEIGEI
jgi:hypothetical protein